MGGDIVCRHQFVRVSGFHCLTCVVHTGIEHAAHSEGTGSLGSEWMAGGTSVDGSRTIVEMAVSRRLIGLGCGCSAMLRYAGQEGAMCVRGEAITAFTLY